MRVVLLCVLVTVAGCGKKKEGDTSSKTAETKPVEATKVEPAPTPAPTPAAPVAESVDICGKLAKDDVAKAVGAINGDPQKMDPQGSMLGMCSYLTADGMASVSARPVAEYDATAKVVHNAKELSGVGDKAVNSDEGVLAVVPGKPYMLQVMVMDVKSRKNDQKKSEELAKLAVDKLK